ncbi:predicted protein [Postia placenta Mad-698-R]|nr:predicted protein [Postia placenta Mad-698-R]
MVLGFLLKKRAPPPPPEAVLPPPSPSLPATELPPPKLPTSEPEQTQLRTPSPSVVSVSAIHGAPQSPSPASRLANLSVEGRVRQHSPTRQATASMSAPLLSPNPVITPPEPTVSSLVNHITAIPAKTLHEYTLAHIPLVPEPLLPALAEFFAKAAPPPKLHCVRCHKDYVDVENDDRSCLVPHDDESAEVERVGRGAKSGRSAGDPGTTYETIWGCCGKVTEGDGDQGPPDGWCYEGKHTTDIKRARFRADSTPQRDKLTSCLRLNCHGIRDQLPRSSLRKRRRSLNLKEPETEEDGSEGEEDSGIDEIVGKATSNGKGKARGKGKTRSEDSQMDVDREQESASQAGSARGRGRAQGDCDAEA